MTTWLQGERSFFFGAQAYLVETDREMASSWAAGHIIANPAYKYVLGRFVEADRANSNKQLFSLKGLQMSRPTITHAPMNMNHSSRRVVGAYVATDLIYPTEGAAAGEPCEHCGEAMPADSTTCAACEQESAGVSDAGLNAYIEALGVFWKHYFPEEYALVEAAHAEGRLFYSMECIPAQIQCSGAEGCGETFKYDGRVSATYCAHLNDHLSDKHLIDPHFTAGAILVPPVRPGWANADIHSLVAKHAELAEQIYVGLQAELTHLDARDWELLMTQLLELSTS